jgi:hypothetical protein
VREARKAIKAARQVAPLSNHTLRLSTTTIAIASATEATLSAMKSHPTHGASDLIVGPAQRSAIGTLVEGQTRVFRLIHLDRADSHSQHPPLAPDLALPSGRHAQVYGALAKVT